MKMINFLRWLHEGSEFVPVNWATVVVINFFNHLLKHNSFKEFVRSKLVLQPVPVWAWGPAYPARSSVLHCQWHRCHPSHSRKTPSRHILKIASTKPSPEADRLRFEGHPGRFSKRQGTIKNTIISSGRSNSVTTFCLTVFCILYL